MKRGTSLVKLMVRLGLLLAATFSFGGNYLGTDLLPGDSPSCPSITAKCAKVVDDAGPGVPPKVFLVAIPEDIQKLYRVAVERGERLSPEGHMSLAFRSGGFRQYVTLTLAQGLFGGFVAIKRIDFIQEQWHANPLDQDEIDQWVVSADVSGTALHLWHKHLLENKGRVLTEEFLPADADSARAIVESIAARFLTPMLRASAIVPNADQSRNHAADIRPGTTGSRVGVQNEIWMCRQAAEQEGRNIGRP